MNQLKQFEQLPQTSAQKLCAGTMVATVPLVSAQEGEKAKRLVVGGFNPIAKYVKPPPRKYIAKVYLISQEINLKTGLLMAEILHQFIW